jgi:hypothetical protein
MREAAAGVSTWLGHGDGRGSWVELVYGRELLTGETMEWSNQTELSSTIATPV